MENVDSQEMSFVPGVKFARRVDTDSDSVVRGMARHETRASELKENSCAEQLMPKED